jgi:hypothetical protein
MRLKTATRLRFFINKIQGLQTMKKCLLAKCVVIGLVFGATVAPAHAVALPGFSNVTASITSGAWDFGTPVSGTVAPGNMAVKLFGSVLNGEGDVSAQWTVSLGRPATAGDQVSGLFNFSAYVEDGSISMAFDPDGNGASSAQPVYTAGSGGGPHSGSFGPFLLPAGATQVVVTLGTVANGAESSFNVPNNSIDLTFIPAAVPEPSAFALAAMSLAGFAAFRRRRKK